MWGSTRKTIRSLPGDPELDIPCGRASNFEPQIVKKHHRVLTAKLERKAIGLHVPWQQLSGHWLPHVTLKRYNVSLINGTLNAVTDKPTPELKAWRSKWANLSAYFCRPEYIRHVIYTTNAELTAHHQLTKTTCLNCSTLGF